MREWRGRRLGRWRCSGWRGRWCRRREFPCVGEAVGVGVAGETFEVGDVFEEEELVSGVGGGVGEDADGEDVGGD